MEFHQHIETSQGEIWTANAITNGFVKSDSESRQHYEAAFLRAMLKAILGEAQLDHEPNGAPFLKNRPDTCISISHSEEWFTVYLSEKQQIGIDIEIPSSRMEKSKKYFLTDIEIEQLQPSSKQLAICWGIKESVVKLLRGKINSMKNDIQITTIDGNQAGAIHQDQKIKLGHEQTEAYTLVYTV
ncbi:MAG: 4'-phosphopantetheinyl transferase superfamily protein [Crocinitomicaceae bacterium]